MCFYLKCGRLLAINEMSADKDIGMKINEEYEWKDDESQGDLFEDTHVTGEEATTNKKHNEGLEVRDFQQVLL